MDDEYLRERKADLEQVVERILAPHEGRGQSALRRLHHLWLQWAPCLQPMD